MTSKSFRLASLIVLLCTQLTELHAKQWFSEYWQRVSWKNFSCNKFTLTSYGEIRSDNHLKNVRYCQLSEQLAYEFCEKLTLGINYSYLHDKSIVPNSNWHWEHRLEIEAINTFSFIGKSYITVRNRLEIRKIENTPPLHYRYRHKTTFVFPIENSSSLKSYSCSNEIFYNFSTHRFNQDRICPISLQFALTEKVTVDTFFLVRLFLHNETWCRSAVIGSQLNF